MKLYFLRHGLAGDPAQWTAADADRPLTSDGRKRMARESKNMSRLSLGLDVIVTSPLLRAKQTAEMVADALKMHHRLVADERLGLGFSIEGLAGVLQDHADGEALMLVGHEPSMSATIGRLIGGARLDLKKGGLARIDVPDASSLQGQLMWLVPPKILAR